MVSAWKMTHVLMQGCGLLVIVLLLHGCDDNQDTSFIGGETPEPTQDTPAVFLLSLDDSLLCDDFSPKKTCNAKSRLKEGETETGDNSVCLEACRAAGHQCCTIKYSPVRCYGGELAVDHGSSNFFATEICALVPTPPPTPASSGSTGLCDEFRPKSSCNIQQRLKAGESGDDIAVCLEACRANGYECCAMKYLPTRCYGGELIAKHNSNNHFAAEVCAPTPAPTSTPTPAPPPCGKFRPQSTCDTRMRLTDGESGGQSGDDAVCLEACRAAGYKCCSTKYSPHRCYGGELVIDHTSNNVFATQTCVLTPTPPPTRSGSDPDPASPTPTPPPAPTPASPAPTTPATPAPTQDGGFECIVNPAIDSRIAEHAGVQPLCKGYLDVTLPPYSAKGDGVTDDSAAIQQAVQDAFDNTLVTFFPGNRRYLISQQIRCVKTSNWWGHAWNGFQLVGSTIGQPPVLVLADNSNVVGNIFIYFQLITSWGQVKPPDHYSAVFRGIHIDMGYNPTVSALSMSGAQWCSIEDIYISGRSFYAGIRGLPGSGGFSGNIEVDGGQIGVWQEQFRPNPSITNLVLRNQSRTGFWHQISRGPVVLSGFEIWSPVEPAFDYRAFRVHGEINRHNMKEGDGALALEDGLIVVKGSHGVAIEIIQANLAFQNVYFQAATTIDQTSRMKQEDWTGCGEWPGSWKPENCEQHKHVLSCSGNGVSPWNHIDKWVRTETSSATIVGGTTLGATTGVYGEHPCGNSVGPPAGLRSIHSWDRALLPSWEDSDLVNIVTDYGATQSWVADRDDDAPKIQQALTDTANPNHRHYQKAVFIPYGTYSVRSTIFLPAGSKIIGVNQKTTIQMAREAGVWTVDQPMFVSEDGNAPTGQTYGLILMDFHLHTHRRGQHFNLRTDKMLWKLVVTSGGLNGQDPFPPLVPFTLFSGQAGGHFYGLTPGPVNFDTSLPEDWGSTFALTTISGTSNPLHFYQLVIAHQPSAHELLIENSANVNLHAFKFESVGIGAGDDGGKVYFGGSLATVRNCEDITMFGGSGNYALTSPEVSRNILEFNQTKNVVLWSMVRRPEGHEMEGGNWIEYVGTDGRIDTWSDDLNILYYASEEP